MSSDFCLIYARHPSHLPGKEGQSDGASNALPASINTNRTSTVTGSSRGGHGAAHGDVYGKMEPILIDSANSVVQRLMLYAPNTWRLLSGRYRIDAHGVLSDSVPFQRQGSIARGVLVHGRRAAEKSWCCNVERACFRGALEAVDILNGSSDQNLSFGLGWRYLFQHGTYYVLGLSKFEVIHLRNWLRPHKTILSSADFCT